jgi:predicted permease
MVKPADAFLSIRRSFRCLTRSRVFSSTVTLTLAVGIGLASGTAVVARGIAFAGLPVHDADRVAVLWGVDRAGSFQHMPLGPTDLAPLAAAMRGVATIAAGDYNGAYDWPFQSSTDGQTALRLKGSLAGGNFFDVLGARPILGRTIRPEDDVIGAPRVMVLSHGAWQRHFGGDPNVLGKSLRAVIWGAPYTIVGVMPAGLDYPRGVEFWTAFAPTAARNGSLADSFFNVDVVARLAPNATLEQARQLLTAYYATLASNGQRHWDGARATVRTLPDLVVGDVRPAFAALSAAAAVVLLVTCGNVAGLLLVRASGRRRELAVRAAIGADRVRLVGELLVEHAVLAIAGGAIGAAIAMLAVRTFRALAPAELPRIADLGVDWTFLGAVICITTFVVLAVGLVPAIAATRIDPAAALGAAREGVGARKRDVAVRRVLVGAQVALALVVLVGAGLLGRSLTHLATLDLGIASPDQLAFVELIPRSPDPGSPQPVESDRAQRIRGLNQVDAIIARVAATPGVNAVAPIVHEPYSGAAGWDVRVEAAGATPNDSSRRPYLNMEVTNADYLRVMRIPLLHGRWLAPADREDAPFVVALNESAARMLFPGTDAVGQRVKLLGGRLATVVGVVGDTRFREFRDPRASVYVSARQTDGASFLAVRSSGSVESVVRATRAAVIETSAPFAVQSHGTLRESVAGQLARPRLIATVIAVYALAVVTLAVAGLYAVVAGSVSSRRREFGVRAALGASPRSLLGLVLREGLSVALIGAGIGAAIALAVSRLWASLLAGVGATDPATIASAVLTLMVVCAVAVLLPARRAAAADPAREIRGD